MGAKRHLNGTSQKGTYVQTDTQTDIATYRLNRPRGPVQRKYIYFGYTTGGTFCQFPSFNSADSGEF